MRQKYVISRDGPGEKLIIKEYAVIESKVKKPAASIAYEARFTFYCEETYESDVISATFSFGIKALVAVLRTNNFYPIEPYATKIAEAVMTLYDTSENGPVELLFDDVDLFSPEMVTA